MKKLALALLAIFILPASLSATGKDATKDAPAADKPAEKTEGYVTWGTRKVTDAGNYVADHKLKTIAVAALVGAAGAAIYYRDRLGCCSQKQKRA